MWELVGGWWAPSSPMPPLAASQEGWLGSAGALLQHPPLHIFHRHHQASWQGAPLAPTHSGGGESEKNIPCIRVCLHVKSYTESHEMGQVLARAPP